ncbi:MAG: serine hydrolase [Cytophagales bacterium]|nr:serine hydrolase [Cytophagales bacterium]
MKPVGPEQTQDTQEYDYISLFVSNLKKYKQMKKVWLAISVFFLSIEAVHAEEVNHLLVDHWVDSIYKKLTVEERIGQLIDLRIEPSSENIEQLVETINANHIGSVTISGGSVEASAALLNKLNATLKVPVFVSAENRFSFNFPFDSSPIIPKPATFEKSGDPRLLKNGIEILADIYSELGISGISYSPYFLRFSESGLSYNKTTGIDSNNLLGNLNALYRQNNIVPNLDFYFSFTNSPAFSPKSFDTWNSNAWKQNIYQAKKRWEKHNISTSIITIKSLPEFPEEACVSFYRKIINPLFWKQLQFGGILSSDFDAITSGNLTKENDEIIRSLIKIGSDKIVLSDDAGGAFNALMKGLDQHMLKQNEIKNKVKRILALKIQAGLLKFKHLNENNLVSKINNPELRKLSYEVYSKSLKLKDTTGKLLPFRDLRDINFASLVLGFSELKTFQETLGKYAPFVHYMLPDVAFDPYDLDILSEQLIQFDHVIIGLHTDGFVELDQSVSNFLGYLNEHTQVVLVFLGKDIDMPELDVFNHRIHVHEDNIFTQQIAAQSLFGAFEKSQRIERLFYSTPEAQRMDSKTLKKIDEIAEEAISMSGTPGCQILVARNGSVVLEKGYGYYTYDSIMPVDTRTIYDLASITKVAATTLAIMKLEEECKINLDSTIGAYLPELKGSNKASLVINDILAHQSGLKAFYPFWQKTIENEDQILHYYNDNPSENYNKTVAYGMFAAEELNDSLWHWTIETKLRKKINKYKPYDYKYSDLGFYLLQVLVERVAGQPMDQYLDSEFYKPMGMSTLGFNPLCKFPLKRITPTEIDTDFRHVLVWGTVHDQIAAMKGGVSGHAGLFGNAHDVAKIMQMNLQEGIYGADRYLEKETVQKFTSQQYKNNRRGLGWDKPERRDGYNPASRYASPDSFGHRGFTGTIAWADPTFDLVFVFLSNRIYPKSSNIKLINFNIRKRIHDVVYESIWNFEKTYN